MRKIGRICFLLFVLIVTKSSSAQQSIATAGTAVTQNFDGMGTSATATLPNGFRVNGGATANWTTGAAATTEAAGTTGTGVLTGSSAGGTYNYANGVTASSTDRALGFLNTGGFSSPRNIIYAFTNNTGVTVTSINISFDYEKYRSGSRAFNWTFFHGATATAVNTAATDGNQSYAADANNTTIFNPPTSIAKTVTLTGLNIANGTTYYLAWTFAGVGGSSNGQGIGIDNFSITLNPVLTPTLNPSPTSLTGFTYLLGAGPSAVQSFTLGGLYLTGFPGDITVNAPANFLVSNAPGGPFGGTALIPFTSATLSAPVYVQLAGGLSVGIYSGNITFSGGGVTTPPTVALSGSVTSVAESNIIAVAASETPTISSLTTGPVTNSTSGVQVWSITIQDGGNDLTDSDLLPTIVNSIILQQNLGNAVNDWADAIEEIALFDGTTKLATGVVTATTITFSGTPLISVPDNGSRTLTIRLTLQTLHNNSGSNLDGDDFVFQIARTDVTADPTGSLFSPNIADFPTAASLNGQNAISVVATELRFTAPPFTTEVNAVMNPGPVVTATDIYGNIDRNISGTVVITSTGTLSGISTTSLAFTSGSATFSNLIHTVVGFGYTLTATSGLLTAATSSTFDITVVGGTSFAKGDLLILAFNSNRDNGLNGIEDDEITFFALKDITNGTVFYLTDNGFEREFAGKWGTSEGFLRILKSSGPTIPAGKILNIGMNLSNGGFSASHFKIFDQCGVDITSQFTLTLTGGTFNSNNQDDFWFGQGGAFSIAGTNDASYTGTILTGWTATGYQPCIGTGANSSQPWNSSDAICSNSQTGTSGTTLVPYTSCFVVNLSTSAIVDRDRVKYTGPLTITDKKGWIDRLNNVANWTGYATDAAYDAGPNYVNAGTCDPLPIDPTPVTPGVWQGNKSTDWFDCDNWTSREVPDITTDVVINSGTYDALVDDASPFATLYSNLAVARNVNISNGKQLSLGSSAGDILNISNNMDLTNANTTFNNGSGILNVGGSITYNTGTIFNGNAGTVNVAGDYTIGAGTTMTPGTGTVVFNGTATQTITNNLMSGIFYNLTINNSSATGVTFAGTTGIFMSGVLTLTDGLLNTNTTNILGLTSTATCPAGGSLASFVNGPMRKTGTANFTFPVGKPVQPTTTLNAPFTPINTGGYRPISISNIGVTAATFEAEYQLANPTIWAINPLATAAGLQGISRCEYWDLTRTSGPVTARPTVTLSWSTNTQGQSQCNVGPYIIDPASTVVVPYYGGQWGDQNSTYFGRSGTFTSPSGPGFIGTISWDGSTGEIDSYQKFVIGTTNWQLAPLPFDLTLFNATGKNKQVQLDWTVNNNHQIKEYTIERSRDGQRFTFFKTVGARAQEQRASYTDVDPAPFAGWSYYRLRAVTHTGEVYYSETRKVHMGQQAEIGISPNPARNILTIRLPDAGSVTELNISNSVGQVLRQLKPTADVLTVDVSAWPSGVYYIRMISATEVIVKPFVKE